MLAQGRPEQVRQAVRRGARDPLRAAGDEDGAFAAELEVGVVGHDGQLAISNWQLANGGGEITAALGWIGTRLGRIGISPGMFPLSPLFIGMSSYWGTGGERGERGESRAEDRVIRTDFVIG